MRLSRDRLPFSKSCGYCSGPAVYEQHLFVEVLVAVYFLDCSSVLTFSFWFLLILWPMSSFAFNSFVEVGWRFLALLPTEGPQSVIFGRLVMLGGDFKICFAVLPSIIFSPLDCTQCVDDAVCLIPFSPKALVILRRMLGTIETSYFVQYTMSDQLQLQSCNDCSRRRLSHDIEFEVIEIVVRHYDIVLLSKREWVHGYSWPRSIQCRL